MPHAPGREEGRRLQPRELVKGILRIHDFQQLKGHGTQVDPESDVDGQAKTVGLKLTIAK